MVFQAVGRSGALYQIERFPQAAGEVVVGFCVLAKTLQQQPRLSRLLAPLWNGGEQFLVDNRFLPHDFAPLQKQRREPDAEHPCFDILDPVANQIAEDGGVGDNSRLNQREEAESNRRAPEQRRTEQGPRKRFEVRHPHTSEANWFDAFLALPVERNSPSIGKVCPTD